MDELFDHDKFLFDPPYWTIINLELADDPDPQARILKVNVERAGMATIRCGLVFTDDDLAQRFIDTKDHPLKPHKMGTHQELVDMLTGLKKAGTYNVAIDFSTGPNRSQIRNTGELIRELAPYLHPQG